MKLASKVGWRVWLLAATGAGIVMGLILVLFRVPRPSPVPVQPARLATVGFKRLHDSGDDLNLLDPTPLFLPTEWNARPHAEPVNALRELGGGFHDFSANLIVAEDATKLAFPPTVVIPAKPVEALAIGTPEGPFLGMGRLDRDVAVPAARVALVEIIAAGDGREVFRQPLQDGAHPPGGSDLYWLEFLAETDSTGLIGLPALTTSSGVEEVDRFFQVYLARVLRVGERLTPGFYRIKVGP
ncbi:MAG: hypothetical protein EXS39_05220 [Opitutaceae bacterium]|nr:hypothetical protein [Opitutaceae bacterium]